ncbi:MAG: M56 family metallopeptidase, partial [Isosphaeraceae bacterium]
ALPVATLVCPQVHVAFPPGVASPPSRLDQSPQSPVERASTRPVQPLGQELALVIPAATAQASAPARSAKVSLTMLLLVSYLAGLGVLLVRLGASVREVARWKRRSKAVDDPRWTEALSLWSRRLNVKRPIRLVSSSDVNVPLAVGWLDPLIVLPDWRDTALAAEQIDAVLVHELAHLRRGDDVWNLIQQFVQVLYWPHPLIWVVGRLMASVREQACDDLCVHCVGGSRSYRSTLVAVAAGLVEQPAEGALVAAPMALGLAMARRSTSSLRRRLSWIMRSPGASRCLSRWPVQVALMAVLLIAATALAVIGPGRAAPIGDDPAQPKVKLAYDRPLPDSVKRSLVEITVVDAATRAPIGLAEVRVTNYVDLRTHRFPTGREGKLRVAYPYSNQPMLALEVRKEGYIPQRASWGFEKKKVDPPRQLTIALRHGVEIGGRVVDEASQPIIGATVVVSVERYGPGDRLKGPLGYEILYEVPFQTDRDGRWRTSSCPPTATEVHLQLIHPDYVSGDGRTFGGPGRRYSSIDKLRKQIDSQVMTKGVRISGQVIDVEGKPIPGARICESSQGLTFLEYVRHTETDLDGRFHLHFDPDEMISLTVQVNGFEPVTRSFVAGPDLGPVEFKLDAGKVIRGRVVDVDGKPLAGALVILQSAPGMKGVVSRIWTDSRGRRHQDSPGILGLFLRTWTDSRGRFVWGSAPAGKVLLSISKKGYTWIDLAPFTADDPEKQVVLKPGLDVEIHARDAVSHEAIKSFSIETGVLDVTTGKVAWKPWLTRGVNDGEYRTTVDATLAPYQFQLKAAGYAPVMSRPVGGDEKDVSLTIDMRRLKNQ